MTVEDFHQVSKLYSLAVTLFKCWEKKNMRNFSSKPSYAIYSLLSRFATFTADRDCIFVTARVFS